VDFSLAGAIVAAAVLTATATGWFVRRQNGLTTTRNLAETLEQVTQQLRDMQAENAISRGRIRQLEDQFHKAIRLIDALNDGIWRLSDQIIRSGDIPEWEPPTGGELLLAEQQMARQPRKIDPQTQIQHFLGVYFSLDELRLLCGGLEGVEFENLPGDTRQIKAMELTDFMFRHGRLNELVEIGQVQRPFLDWPEVS
jgi:hypothetical protein